MKRSLLLLGGVAVAAVAAATALGVLSARPSSAAVAKRESPGFLLLPPAAPAGQMTLYGHIKTITRASGHYLLGFDPALFTSGITASRAAKQDTGSGDVPNDNYIIEEGHRVLTYILPLNARVTVLTNNGTGIASVAIPVPELSRIVNGGPHRKLFEPLESGIWIRIRIDTIRELDQQYRP
jgi:hypothetical protein